MGGSQGRKHTVGITAVEAEGDEDDSGEDNATPSTSTSVAGSGSGDGSSDRELQESVAPRKKASGKKQSEKSEFQGKLLDFLERDLQRDQKEQQSSDDPIDLQVMSMAQRIKKELPAGDQFTVLLKLQEVLNESIRSVSRREMVNNTPMGPEVFFQQGAEVRQVEEVVMQRRMPELQRGPQVQTEPVDVERTLHFTDL